MIRLRRFAASARQARLRTFAASARQARLRTFAATAGQGRAGIATAVFTAVAVLTGGSSTVLACPVCFGAEETSIIDGARLGVAVLLAVTLTVQGGFVAFFLYLRKRAKRNADIELDHEWSKLQRASRS
jgi:hypothetical protein